MKATYNRHIVPTFNRRHRLESRFASSMTIIDLGIAAAATFRGQADVIVARFYNTQAASRACVWIRRRIVGTQRRQRLGEYVETHGSALVGGYGFHRPSQALQDALANAGFTLDTPIDGRGEPPMREALLAVALELGVKKPYLVEAHP